MTWPDGKQRCIWANPKNPLYLAYHDHEWGVPIHDDKKFLEMLILEMFQAGLSWECVLNKREAFRKAFDGFELEKICAYDERKIAELAGNAEIIRNRQKIAAAINNARIFRKMADEWGSFAEYIWHWTDNQVVYEKCRTRSPLSELVSGDLKKNGMKFCGPVSVYSLLQSTGIIYSHETGCFLEHQ